MIRSLAEDLRMTMAANPAIGISAEIGMDEEFVLDSLAVTWLVYHVQEMFGIDLDVMDERVSGRTSVLAIAAYLESLRGRDER